MSALKLRLAALALLAFAIPALADDQFNMDIKVDGVQLGDNVMGTKLALADLQGRVVMLEFWGIRCGPCLASLPHVAKINDELSGFGLVVIGAHAQEGTTEQIRNTAKSRGVNFTIVENARVRDGNDFTGIPHCMIFDHTGKCVYRGHPMKAESVLRETVGKALAAKIEGTPAKSVEKVLENLKKGQSPAAALQRALTISKGSDKEAAAQAKQLIAAMTEVASRQLDQAQAQRSTEPVAVLPRLSRLSNDFKGTEVGAKATAVLSELKKDKIVMAEVKARPALEAIRQVDSLLQAAAGDGDVKSEDFQKAQAGVLKKLGATIKMMKKNWPNAPATAEALEVAERYGIEIK